MKGIEKSLDISYNLDYLVILPSRVANLFDSFNYTFGNTILFDNTPEDTEFMISFLRKNTVGQIIFVDYYREYDEIINSLMDEHEIKFIIARSQGELSDQYAFGELLAIFDKYNDNIASRVGFIDKYLYMSIRQRHENVDFLLLDIEKTKKNGFRDNGLIGLLNLGTRDYDSFYNELSSFSLIKGCIPKIYNAPRVAKQFLETYNIKSKEVATIDDLFDGGCVNLCVNFSGLNNVDFLRSMDLGIPCIVGNNFILNENNDKVLSDLLVMCSDDDVNELSERIVRVQKNRSKIFNYYDDFRERYSNKSKHLVDSFLGLKRDAIRGKTSEKLLSVIVPVYNTEQYVEKCLKSLIRAAIDEMEILVINDGSADDSEEIIKRYEGKYPKLIRYIKKKNGGLGSVRNLGLSEARGKYFASVDSDDTIEPEFFSEALFYMKNDIDVIICDWMSTSEDTKFLTPAVDPVFNNRKTYEGIMYTTIMPSTCNKIFKTELFNGLEYYDRKYEDLSINPIAMLRAKSIKYLAKPYYNYYLRDNSLMRSKINPKEMVDVLSLLSPKIDNMNIVINKEELEYYTYSWRIEEYILNPLIELDGKELSEAISYINKKIYDLIIRVIDSEYYGQMVKGLTNEKQKYIVGRNRALKEKKLEAFYNSKNRKHYKITASTIYYGS